jgi:hypothetical protein
LFVKTKHCPPDLTSSPFTRNQKAHVKKLIFAKAKKRDGSVLKMSEKKVVSRNIAIGIGVLCIILLVGMVGARALFQH